MSNDITATTGTYSSSTIQEAFPSVATLSESEDENETDDGSSIDHHTLNNANDFLKHALVIHCQILNIRRLVSELPGKCDTYCAIYQLKPKSFYSRFTGRVDTAGSNVEQDRSCA